MYVIYSTATGYSDESMRHATRQEAIEHKRKLEAVSYTDFAIRYEEDEDDVCGCKDPYCQA